LQESSPRDQLQLGGAILLLALPWTLWTAQSLAPCSAPAGSAASSTRWIASRRIIFAALGYHFAVHNQFDYLLLAFASLMGSYVVSYVRARREAGCPSRSGFLTAL
jgi:hypothetical protein